MKEGGREGGKAAEERGEAGAEGGGAARATPERAPAATDRRLRVRLARPMTGE